MGNLNESAEYLPLTSESNAEDGFGNRDRRTTRPTHALREKLLVLVVLLQAVALVASVLTRTFSTTGTCHCPQSDRSILYSPAEVALESQVKVFTAGRKHKTIYQGLSHDVDKAWGRLYNHTIMKIPRSEAALLPNKTYPVEHEPGYYLASLDVFHQLHCLNNVRRALHRDHYANDTDLDEEHVSHCVDSIRQSLMCNADISVNVWQWSTELSVVVGHSTQAHSCRNFEMLRDWAQQRQLDEWIDFRLFVEDDLPTPPIIH